MHPVFSNEPSPETWKLIYKFAYEHGFVKLTDEEIEEILKQQRRNLNESTASNSPF